MKTKETKSAVERSLMLVRARAGREALGNARLTREGELGSTRHPNTLTVTHISGQTARCVRVCDRKMDVGGGGVRECTHMHSVDHTGKLVNVSEDERSPQLCKHTRMHRYKGPFPGCSQVF